jgi:uncharacterized damage-inducible protein DinB
MPAYDPGRPAPDESLPYYHQYIALVPDGNVVDILARQAEMVRDYCAALSDAQTRARSAPGEWNVREVVGHLADSERVFAYRALRIARGEPTPWTNADLELYVASADFERRAMPDLLADYAAVRGATVALLRGLDEAAWQRRAPADWTTRSARAIAYVLAGHDLHHLAGFRAQFGEAAGVVTGAA